MKKYLIIKIIVLLTALNAWPQGYQSIFDKDSTTWYQARSAIDRTDHIVIKTLSDTVIDTMQYKKIDVKEIFEDSDFFLREDTTLGKVWIYDIENHKEYLIMDLSLNIGDTFRLKNPSYSYQDSIAIVDSIYNHNDKKHIRLDYEIQINLKTDKLTFIEGIGPNAGFIYQIKTLKDNCPYCQILLCMYKGSQRVYKSEYAKENCTFDFSNVIIDNTIQVDDYSIYPNPVINFFCISNPNNTKGILEIYNTRGILMNAYHIKGSSREIINTSGYKEGVYMLLFKNDKKVHSIGTIVKKYE